MNVEPALLQATTAEWLARAAKSPGDAAAVRDLLRLRIGDARAADYMAKAWTALRDFVWAQKTELDKLPEADAARGRRLLGRVVAELDERSGDVVPDDSYDWLFK